MKIAIAAALLAALSLPIGASAQVVQPGAPVQGQRSSGANQYKHWMKRLAGLNLSGTQQQQVQNVLGQFAQQHPAGSPRDPQAAHALRQQIFSILSPAQQSQLQQEMRAMHAEKQQRHAQQVQQQQAPPPPAR